MSVMFLLLVIGLSNEPRVTSRQIKTRAINFP